MSCRTAIGFGFGLWFGNVSDGGENLVWRKETLFVKVTYLFNKISLIKVFRRLHGKLPIITFIWHENDGVAH